MRGGGGKRRQRRDRRRRRPEWGWGEDKRERGAVFLYSFLDLRVKYKIKATPMATCNVKNQDFKLVTLAYVALRSSSNERDVP